MVKQTSQATIMKPKVKEPKNKKANIDAGIYNPYPEFG